MVSRKRSLKRQKQEIRRQEHRRDTVKVLKTLGLWDILNGTSALHEFVDTQYPSPKVVLSGDLQGNAAAERILSESERLLSKCAFDAPLLDSSYRVVDFFSRVKPVLDRLNGTTSPDSELNRRISDAKSRLAVLEDPEIAVNAAMTAFRQLEQVLIRHSRIDLRLYHLEIVWGRNEHQKWYTNFLIQHRDPVHRGVLKDGGRRTAYRCGQPAGRMDIAWVSLDGGLIGREGVVFPVYVQKHALDQIYGTNGRLLFLENGEWLLHDHLWQSLRSPVVFPTGEDGSTFLIEYRLNVHKLGYLVASIIGDIVLIETFLFLTMNGTPEGDRLWQRLRLRRADKEYLGLDTIETFLFSDLQHDADLCALLHDCGCGHLFSILKTPIPVERCVAGYAEDMRKYIQSTLRR